MTDLLLADYTVPQDATLLDAAAKIARNSSRTAMIEATGRIIGIISEGDILNALLQGANIYAPLQKYGRASFKYLKTRDYGEAWKIFRKHQISLLPIVSESFELLDVITLGEMLAQAELVSH